MNKRFRFVVMIMLFSLFSFVGCGKEEKVTIRLYAAKSLNSVMDEMIQQYENEHKNVEIIPSYDSSGTLMLQIEEGAECDIFFSAAQKQMKELEEKGFIAEGTKRELLKNQVCVVTQMDKETEVKGLDTLDGAKNIALADGSVPVGKYTRQALLNAGKLVSDKEASNVTTQEVSEALGGVEINECANVGAVTTAIAEGANEIGTIYYSDLYGYEDKIRIIEEIPVELTGDVIYPIARVKNEKADKKRIEETNRFLEYVSSHEATALFEKYYFKK